MKQILSKLAIIASLLFTLSACSSDNFVIEGEIKDMGTQNLRIVYISNGVVSSMWMPVVDGKFSFKGNSPEFTIVEILNKNMEPLCNVAAKNGDDIVITGSIKDIYNLKISGSDINERWSKFINDNSEALQKGNREKVEINIEKYVRQNPKDEVSGMLLALIYANTSNVAAIEKLFASLDENSIPKYLKERFQSITEENDPSSESIKQMQSFILYSSKDSLENFNPANGKVSLLYFWISENKGRSEIISELKTLRNNHKGLQIADITLESDSAVWKKELRNDSISNWKHFWGLGGRMNNEVKKMGVKSAPFFLVTDSAGTPLYRGVSLDAASAAIDKKLTKKKP